MTKDCDEFAAVLSADGGSLGAEAEPGAREAAEAMEKMVLGVEPAARETVGTLSRAVAGGGGVLFLSTITASQKLSVGRRRGQPGRTPGSWNKWSMVFALREGRHKVLRDSLRWALFSFTKCFTGFITLFPFQQTENLLMHTKCMLLFVYLS